MNVIVSSDSTCDLSPELINQFGIRIIPLYIVKGDKAYKDTIEISPEDIFEWVDGGNGVCSTSAVNTADYIDFFSSLRSECDAVIHFTISSDMSVCYANACLAAEEVENVYVVDSRNLSTGIGNLVLDAAAMAMEGTHSAEDIYNTIVAETGLPETSFIIDKLDYLAKGGRCSPWQVWFAVAATRGKARSGAIAPSGRPRRPAVCRRKRPYRPSRPPGQS